ncbi:DNA helicase [Tanacetum coccineum]
MVQGESTTYVSHDEATPVGNDRAETEMLYPVEHLNTLKLPEFPPHRLELKVGTLMRFLALGWHLEEIHVTWAHLEKKQARLQTYTKSLEDLCIQRVKTASQA